MACATQVEFSVTRDRAAWRTGREINVAGPITPLGGTAVHASVIATVSEVLGCAVDVAELQALAGDAIRAAFSVEAGGVVSCLAAGIAQTVAATSEESSSFRTRLA